MAVAPKNALDIQKGLIDGDLFEFRREGDKDGHDLPGDLGVVAVVAGHEDSVRAPPIGFP